MQSVYLDIPQSDWQLLKDLAKKFGWKAQSSEEMLSAFVASRPKGMDITEEEIIAEVKAVRRGK